MKNQYDKVINNQDGLYMIRDIGIIITIPMLFCRIFYDIFVRTFSGISYYLFFIIIVGIIILSKVIKRVDKNLKKQLLWFILWFIQYFIINQILLDSEYRNNLMGLNLNILVLQLIQVLFIVFISIQINTNTKYDKKIVQLFIISMIINIIFTLRALKIDPNISKVMATGNSQMYTNIDTTGVAGYSIIYALVILIPILLYAIGNLNRKKRYFYIATFLLSIFFIFKTGYFTAFTLMIVGIFIYYIIICKPVYKIILFPMFIFVISMIVNPSIMYDILIYLSNIIEVETISQRLYQVAEYIGFGKKGAALLRVDLYMQSIEQFLRFPFTGGAIFNNNIQLSGHSAFLDIAGSGGILHIITYFMFIYYSYKYSIKLALDKLGRCAIKTSYIVFILLGLVNTLATDNIIMMSLIGILPALMRYINYLGEKENEYSMVK